MAFDHFFDFFKLLGATFDEHFDILHDMVFRSSRAQVRAFIVLNAVLCVVLLLELAHLGLQFLVLPLLLVKSYLILVRLALDNPL